MRKAITRSAEYIDTFRNAKVAGMFDLEPTQKMTRTWEVELPIEEKDWKIGLIVGSSGSGKTTIAKTFFEKGYWEEKNWDNNSIVDNFDSSIDIKTIVNLLCHVGFSSPPNWLLSYHQLSNGQKFRVDLARALLSDCPLVAIDEFTSVVDRTVAKTSCVAAHKSIHKLQNKQLIAVSCHSDITHWLQPDWVYDVDKDQFKWVRLRRPDIKLQIYKLNNESKQGIWRIFKHHHYLSGQLVQGAIAFVGLIEDSFCGFSSARTAPVPTGNYIYQEHRTVVLPDYQGAGIGNKMAEFLGQYIWDTRKKILRSTTSHPAMIFYRNQSKRWQLTNTPKIQSKIHRKQTLKRTGAYNRLTASFKFIPNIPN